VAGHVRQCRKYDLSWTKPSTFPRLALLPMRVALLGAGQPWIGEFCKSIMVLNFVADRDVNSRENVGEVLVRLGLPAEKIIDDAQAEQNKLRLRQQSGTGQGQRHLRRAHIFCGSEMFWGNDRLDDTLAFAAGQTGVAARPFG